MSYELLHKSDNPIINSKVFVYYFQLFYDFETKHYSPRISFTNIEKVATDRFTNKQSNLLNEIINFDSVSWIKLMKYFSMQIHAYKDMTAIFDNTPISFTLNINHSKSFTIDELFVWLDDLTVINQRFGKYLGDAVYSTLEFNRDYLSSLEYAN